MKSLVFYFPLFFLLNNSFLYAQHEYDKWFFGSGAGVDFTSGTPAVITGGQIVTEEGTASIADAMGNLLFYTDGVTVWNKNHMVMVNGTGLHGGSSSSQSALIIKIPGSDSLYYIFTTGQSLSNGFKYSIVNVSLQGNLGEVILKNVPLLPECTERLSATKQSNGIDYWIIIHGWDNNNFYAYQFSADGVDPTPVISAAGTVHTGPGADYIGYLKTSHKGHHLAVTIHDSNYFELFDFDKETGIVSNALFIDGISTSIGPYGIEFSPNDSLLYGAEYQPGKILQWDISSGNGATIIGSQNLVGTAASSYGGALALASDGKIYMARRSESWLGAIENPDIYGLGCNYVDQAFNISPNSNLSGLPNIPPYWFDVSTNTAPIASFLSTGTVFCEASCISFIDQSVNDPTSWQWLFPGGSPASSTSQNPTNICYYLTGTNDVTLIVTNVAGSDTITLSNLITILMAPLAAIIQTGNTLSTIPASSYQWSFNGGLIPGATNQTLEISQTGSYSVTVGNSNDCTATDTLLITFIPANNLSASDTLVCEKFCIDFSDQSTNNPSSWLWEFQGGIPSSSSNQNPLDVCYYDPGTYDVTLITTNAFGTDTLTLTDYIAVLPTPPFPVISQNGSILTSSPADFYQWQFNNNDIPGATNQSYTVTQTGYYTVVISDLHGCKNSATMYIDITGIGDLLAEQQIFIHPNPSNGHFIIDWRDNSVAAINIEIYNPLGQSVYSSNVAIWTSDWKKDIILTNINSGIYFIEISGISSNKARDVFARKKIIIAK
ncbi:MAG: PKD domain-containing protein [Chitinophagales bacterium]